MKNWPLRLGPYGALALLSLLYALNFFHRQIMAVLIEDVRADLGFSDTQVGMLTGVAFAMFYVIAAVPIARLADRYARGVIIGLCVLLWSGMTMASGLAQNFTQLMLARMGVGVGEAGYGPAANAFLASVFPPERLVGPAAIFSSCAAIGVFLAFAVGGTLNQLWGWRATLIVSGACVALVGVVALLTLKEPAGERALGERAGLAAAARAIFGSRRFLLIAIGASLGAFGEGALYQWYAAFVVRTYAVDLSLYGWQIGLALSLSGFLGILIGGMVIQRLIQRDRSWLYLGPAAAFAAAGMLAPFVFHASSVEVSLLFLGVTMFFSASYFGPTVAAIQDLVPNEVRATAIAVYLAMLNGIGYGLGPLVTGAVSDALAATAGPHSLRWALTVAGMAYVIAAIFFFVAERQVRRSEVAGVSNA